MYASAQELVNLASTAAERKFYKHVPDDMQSIRSMLRLAGGCKGDK